MSSSSFPNVTILLASYNRLALLKDAVASALAQVYPAFDVLVVDDGSGEDTRAWLRDESAREPKLEVLIQDNQGVATARQRGLETARGDYVCILDSDDLLTPDALSLIMAFFEAHPETDLVYTDNVHVLDDGAQHVRRYRSFPTNRAMMRATFLYPRCPFKHSGTTYRRERALAMGGYDTSLRIKIDIEFFLKILAHGGHVRHLAEPVVQFRMHADSISRNRWEGVRAYWGLIDRYGPSNVVGRVVYKGVRAFWEGAKAAALAVRFRAAGGAE